ncbi:hypothetical protein BDD12DRAFT_807428 [Trichophaea hybrida]|nr:hypothetical protein BDD12DRAFT_807428 [Trichophaea hybrida]
MASFFISFIFLFGFGPVAFLVFDAGWLGHEAGGLPPPLASPAPTSLACPHWSRLPPPASPAPIGLAYRHAEEDGSALILGFGFGNQHGSVNHFRTSALTPEALSIDLEHLRSLEHRIDSVTITWVDSVSPAASTTSGLTPCPHPPLGRLRVPFRLWVDSVSPSSSLG